VAANAKPLSISFELINEIIFKQMNNSAMLIIIETKNGTNQHFVEIICFSWQNTDKDKKRMKLNFGNTGIGRNLILQRM